MRAIDIRGPANVSCAVARRLNRRPVHKVQEGTPGGQRQVQTKEPDLTKGKTMKTYTHYVYEVVKNRQVVATYVFEQDAIDHVAKTGGEIRQVGAY